MKSLSSFSELQQRDLASYSRDEVITATDSAVYHRMRMHPNEC